MRKTTKLKVQALKVQARSLAQISIDRFLHNLKLIHRLANHKPLIPMIKADAYGHGAVPIFQALAASRDPAIKKSVHGVGVATFREAVILRSQAPFTRMRIIIFSDSSPWTEEKHALCMQHQLDPVFYEPLSLSQFLSNGNLSSGHRKVRFHLEINSGMNRLGIPLDAAQGWVHGLVQNKPTSIFTHFAESEIPSSSLTQSQLKVLSNVTAWVHNQLPQTLLHAANSAAIWNQGKMKPLDKMDLVRPGLSLYGIRPYEKAKDLGLKRVMHASAPIGQVMHHPLGARIGYNGTYQVRKKSGAWVATLLGGYADGIFRSLSNQGCFFLPGGSKAPVLGRVSMDLTTVLADSKSRIGDRVEFWGDRVDPYRMAADAGTNPYELVTRMGDRLDKIWLREGDWT